MKYKRVLIYGDTHFQYQDDKILSLIHKFAVWFKPELIIHGGDLLDFYKLSRFDKDPLTIERVNDEIRMGYNHLVKMRKLSKDFDFIEGNHELRMDKYLNTNATELKGIKRGSGGESVLSVKYLLELDNLKIKYIPMRGRESHKKYNNIYVGHFNKINKHSAYTAKSLVEEKGVSIIQGHTHRGGVHYKTTLAGDLVGIENFCTCNLSPCYMQSPNWQHGFTVMYLDPNGRRFSAYPIKITDYKFLFGDRKFSV